MELFSKSLTWTDVHKRLSIPIKSLVSFPDFQGGHTVDFLVKDESGRVWTFGCSTRKTNYLKPVLSRGWRGFIRSKDLNIGDIIVFYKEEDQATGANYKIKVKKAIKLFRVTMGYAPPRCPG